MSSGPRRKGRQLSPEEKWQVFLEVCSQQLSQADAARKWGVAVSTGIKLRRLGKDGALPAVASSGPGEGGGAAGVRGFQGGPAGAGRAARDRGAARRDRAPGGGLEGVRDRGR